MKQLKIIFCCWLLCCETLVAQPFSHGHAHNDYVHKHPLFDALKYGFTSIEVDVFLHNGKLVVSHNPKKLDRKPDLESLYLRPLDSIVKANNGWAFTILMIEFKTSGNEAYPVLKTLLNKYKDILTVYHQSTVEKYAPVAILITGSTPDVSLLGDTSFVTLDGNFSALNNPYVTRVSQSWSSVFHHNLVLNKKDVETLKALVTQAHSAGKQIRFWAIPDNSMTWKVLSENNVDWINTNRLKSFFKWQNRR